MEKLNVHLENGRWIGYVLLNGIAVRLASADDLNDLRYYAKREAFDGILFGGPAVGTPWGTIKVER